MRPASTSRRSASSCLLSRKPRIGRCGSRTTAAAKTGPKRAPRPASSTPAISRKPRDCASRSCLPLQRPRNTTAAPLLAFLQTGSLAAQAAKVVKLRPAHASSADHVDMVDYRSVHREDSFDALAEADLANGDGLAHAAVIAGNDNTLKRLQTLLVAFPDFDVHPDRI